MKGVNPGAHSFASVWRALGSAHPRIGPVGAYKILFKDFFLPKGNFINFKKRINKNDNIKYNY